jgi:RNA polymerase sigma factor (sigma-70 family)
VNSLTDQQLLRDYAERRSEAAFAELVRRHVDLIYSAALRLVCDSHLAEDVTQGAFVALARSAPQLTERAVLSGWLHRTAQNIAAQTVRTDVRRRAREQEAAAMNELFATEPDGVWEHIAPHLDAALGELSEGDRDALLLRYFELKSAQEMAQVLGVSDEAAQKRVSRAVERLREFFAKRGVTVGASGLVIVISANAVQAAPIGLVVTISTAVLAGTAIAATTATAVKALAMTTTQKLLVAVIVVASLMTPVLVQHRVRTKLAVQERALRRQADRLTELQNENQSLANFLAQANRLGLLPTAQFIELLRLRGQVSRLNLDVQELAQLKVAGSPTESNVLAATAKGWSERVEQLKQWLESNPTGKIPELKFLTDQEWIEAIYRRTLDSDEEYRRAMSNVRADAEIHVFDILHVALRKYAQVSNEQLPSDLSQLSPYFSSPLDTAILNRYEIMSADGLVNELQNGDEWVITQKAPVDEVWDARQVIGMTHGGMADSRVTNRWVRTR